VELVSPQHVSVYFQIFLHMLLFEYGEFSKNNADGIFLRIAGELFIRGIYIEHKSVLAEYDDGFRRFFEQGAVALLALSQLPFKAALLERLLYGGAQAVAADGLYQICERIGFEGRRKISGELSAVR